MPLTVPAHQVLVLPLLRGRASPLPGVALLVGTVLPDLAFVVGGYGLNKHSHLAYGPLFMAPLGLLLYAWCETLLAPSLGWKTRGVATTGIGWACVVFAVLLGAYSHLLFDGFTHPGWWPGRALYSPTIAKVLQLVASVIGSVIVVMWARRRRLRWNIRALATAALLGWLIGLAIGLVIFGWPDGKRALVLLTMSPAALGAFAGATAAAYLPPRA